jgi:hypothetical protein
MMPQNHKINCYNIIIYLWRQVKNMKLPSYETLYRIMVFLLVLMVILGILFDTDYH